RGRAGAAELAADRPTQQHRSKEVIGSKKGSIGDDRRLQSKSVTLDVPSASVVAASAAACLAATRSCCYTWSRAW
uniref:Uncharacterized protein n=1 Tax=Triticum urartu TaxID=4572 RepID=A0A8R7TCF8_TRIUA